MGLQGGLLKVATGLLDSGDCAVLGLDKLKDIGRNSLLAEFPGSGFGGGSGSFFNTFLEIEVVGF